MKLKTTNQSILRIQESLVVIKKCVEKSGFKLSNNIEDLFTIIEDIFFVLEDEWNADIAAYCINILKVVLIVPVYALKMKQEIMTRIILISAFSSLIFQKNILFSSSHFVMIFLFLSQFLKKLFLISIQSY